MSSIYFLEEVVVSQRVQKFLPFVEMLNLTTWLCRTYSWHLWNCKMGRMPLKYVK